MEGEFHGVPKAKVITSVSASPTTQVALASIGAPPNFDPLHEFHLHLEKKMEVSAGIKCKGCNADERGLVCSFPFGMYLASLSSFFFF